jgi:hypothetical protein
MSSRTPEHPSEPRPGVLDPAWEDALRAGQAEDGGAGSVEAELAVIHLLRHARAPEALAPAALDRVWQAGVLPQLSPVPWWRRRWLWGAVPVAAAAALLVVVLARPDGTDAGEEGVALTGGAPMIADAAAAPSPARTLERQFAQLEGDARRDLGDSVDRGRGVLRAQLLADAVGTGGTP